VKLNQHTKLVVAVAIFAIAFGIFAIQFLFRGNDAADFANAVVCIDADTGAVVKDFVPPAGKMMPWEGKGYKSLYAAERCYYTKDGKVKSEPTYVLVKRLMGKDEETVCPDCGRKVVLRNPSPSIELIEQARKEGR
jgi:hypothetical protein